MLKNKGLFKSVFNFIRLKCVICVLEYFKCFNCLVKFNVLIEVVIERIFLMFLFISFNKNFFILML